MPVNKSIQQVLPTMNRRGRGGDADNSDNSDNREAAEVLMYPQGDKRAKFDSGTDPSWDYDYAQGPKKIMQWDGNVYHMCLDYADKPRYWPIKRPLVSGQPILDLDNEDEIQRSVSWAKIRMAQLELDDAKQNTGPATYNDEDDEDNAKGLEEMYQRDYDDEPEFDDDRVEEEEEETDECDRVQQQIEPDKEEEQEEDENNLNDDVATTSGYDLPPEVEDADIGNPDVEFRVDQRTGLYRITMPVADCFRGLVIGQRGRRKDQIEFENRVRLQMSQGNDYVGPRGLTIMGSSKRDILAARDQVLEIIWSKRQAMKFSHFVSVPLIEEPFQAKYEQFKQSVLKYLPDTRGISPILFIKPDRLHLTICTLVLIDSPERRLATNYLKRFVNAYMKTLDIDGPLKIRLRGLEYMNDDPSETDVLYAKLDPNHEHNLYLQGLADEIYSKFRSTKLMPRHSNHNYERLSLDGKKVLLHMTVMNSKFRNEDSEDFDPRQLKEAPKQPSPSKANLGAELGRSSPNPSPSKNPGHASPSHHKDREAFDARPILENFADYDFGVIEIKEFHISERYASDHMNGYYKATCRIPLKVTKNPQKKK